MQEIGHLLLPWYDRFHRELPWRGVQDPYAIWVSETMLQQTRVETVRSYFPRFMARFPSLAALAQAPLEDVLKCWEGLGYYRRAQNLHRGAQQVMDAYGGRLPADPAALRRITGIGPYTAGAIASIAFGIPCPAVDGNVIRVVSRVAGIREDVAVPSVARQIAATAASWIPLQRPGDFNQALMDLGASHCCPGTPDCARWALPGTCLPIRCGKCAFTCCMLPVQPLRGINSLLPMKSTRCRFPPPCAAPRRWPWRYCPARKEPSHAIE